MPCARHGEGPISTGLVRTAPASTASAWSSAVTPDIAKLVERVQAEIFPVGYSQTAPSIAAKINAEINAERKEAAQALIAMQLKYGAQMGLNRAQQTTIKRLEGEIERQRQVIMELNNTESEALTEALNKCERENATLTTEGYARGVTDADKAMRACTFHVLTTADIELVRGVRERHSAAIRALVKDDNG